MEEDNMYPQNHKRKENYYLKDVIFFYSLIKFIYKIEIFFILLKKKKIINSFKKKVN